jgi:hypothetical protein
LITKIAIGIVIVIVTLRGDVQAAEQTAIHAASRGREVEALCAAVIFRVRDFCGRFCCLALSRKPSIHLRAGNFHGATRAGRNPKTKAMQFDDRGDHAQAQTEAFGVSTLL